MRCKPGDLAIVVRATTAPEALGSIVEVLRWYPGGYFSEGWVVLWHGEEWHTTDESLRPLRPDCEPESTETPRELEAA